jgi:hypothetical protein
MTIEDALYRRVNLAAASLGISSSSFIRGACQAALATLAEKDPALRAHFAFLDEREARGATSAERPASRESVPA